MHTDANMYAGATLRIIQYYMTTVIITFFYSVRLIPQYPYLDLAVGTETHMQASDLLGLQENLFRMHAADNFIA